MAAANASYELPPLPEYTLHPLPPYFSWISDEQVAAALPVIVYWLVSLFYHVVDVYDLFPQYRLHTPAEVLKRNHATRYDVLRDVIVQQIMQTAGALSLSWLDEPATFGKADYDIAWYAQELRLAQRAVPALLSGVGVNAAALASKMAATQPMLANVLRGGHYPGLIQTITVAGQESTAPAFASWELAAASALYWYVIPALQLVAAIIIMDSWEYLVHRTMHMNKWLYVTFHSRHHRLYVPYAYGALYNHPVEGVIMDTCGAGLSYLITGMTVRQSWVFFSISTIKTVLDHSGYDFPWDPLRLIFSNNAAFHDIHHQSWGIKTNFSQPFFTFWDRVLGTVYQGDPKEKYERQRRTAEQKLAQEKENRLVAEPTSAATTASVSTPGSTRRKAASISQSPAGNLKGLRNKVNESFHGKRANVLGMESSH